MRLSLILKLLLFVSVLLLPMPNSAATISTLSGHVLIPEALQSMITQQVYPSLYKKSTDRTTPSPMIDVIVYVQSVPGPHPPSQKNTVLHHKAQFFTPRVVATLRGTRVVIVNDDPYEHRLESHSTLNPPFTRILKTAGDFQLIKPARDEEIVVSCSSHMKSEATLLVLQNPFFTTVADDGSFSLKGLPPGKYNVRAWHPLLMPASADFTITKGQNTRMDLNFEKVR